MVLVIVILNGGDGESNGNGDIDDIVLVRRNETKKETKKTKETSLQRMQFIAMCEELLLRHSSYTHSMRVCNSLLFSNSNVGRSYWSHFQHCRKWRQGRRNSRICLLWCHEARPASAHGQFGEGIG